MKLHEDIVSFFKNQGFVIISTIDPKGYIHNAAKGIVGIESEGKIYLIDLYKATTFNNLKKNPTASITAIDERQFIGYTLKGKAKIVEREKIEEHIIKGWEDKVIQRISQRVIRDVKADRKIDHHPEAKFPSPQYLIEVDVEEVVDLAPGHLKKR
jgi:uncharacterized pyridoxamine 5'-phosphate oxidase family protein